MGLRELDLYRVYRQPRENQRSRTALRKLPVGLLLERVIVGEGRTARVQMDVEDGKIPET